MRTRERERALHQLAIILALQVQSLAQAITERVKHQLQPLITPSASPGLVIPDLHPDLRDDASPALVEPVQTVGLDTRRSSSNIPVHHHAPPYTPPAQILVSPVNTLTKTCSISGITRVTVTLLWKPLHVGLGCNVHNFSNSPYGLAKPLRVNARCIFLAVTSMKRIPRSFDGTCFLKASRRSAKIDVIS